MISSQVYVTNNSELGSLVELIKEAQLVALDTEFTREKTYYPVLSLIQVAVKKGDQQKLFIVDALSDVDLADLSAVIFDRNITKILHASLQDLQIFCQKNKVAGATVLENLSRSVVDTQVMANFCGFGFNSGYSTIVENLLQRKIDKTLQRSDWQKRPLSAQQLEYALYDVVFLQEVHQKLYEILQQKNRQKWYEEEIKNFVTKVFTESQDNLFKNFSFKGRSREEVSRLCNLILWRESWAKKLDLPRQHFMRDYALERVAYSQDYDLRLDDEKISEIKEILGRESEDREKFSTKQEGNFMSDRQKNTYKKAKDLLAEVAREENLQEQFLITSQGLKNLVCSKKPLEESLTGWRYELLGDRLKNLIVNN